MCDCVINLAIPLDIRWWHLYGMKHGSSFRFCMCWISERPILWRSYFPVIHKVCSLTKSSAVSRRPHDASCPSVVSFNSTIPQVPSFVTFCTKSAVFFSVRLQISERPWHQSAWNFAWWHISVTDRSYPLFGAVPLVVPTSEILAIWPRISQKR